MTDCHTSRSQEQKPDWFLWANLIPVTLLYLTYWLGRDQIQTMSWLLHLSHSVFDFINTMWWGVAIGIIMLSLLSKVPREFVMKILGHKKGIGAIARAAMAGTLLDLCSHGILMVGAKLYERGASAGQLMAFLISSPWNSISLTLVLIALIGLEWTLLFIVLSAVIAMITGLVFDLLVDKKVLPDNPNKVTMNGDFKFWAEAKKRVSQTKWTPSLFIDMALNGIKESRMVIRWLLFGVLAASLLRVFLDPATFEQFFGPTLLGLSATIIFATILEVCSEGSAPIATDILNRGQAPGNAFAFLMAGVSTDYTEIMVLKETTKSWKIALFLPLITLPQVILLGWIINIAG